MLNVTTEVVHDQVGWKKINGINAYLHANGAIGISEHNIYGKKDRTIEVDYGLNSLEVFQYTNDMVRITKDHAITITMLMYSHLAVMKEIFKDCGFSPKFLLWVHGLTGSMKTTICKLFLIFLTDQKNTFHLHLKTQRPLLK